MTSDDAYALEVLAAMVEAAGAYKQASQGDDILSQDTRQKIDRVVARFCKQVLGETDD